MTSNLTKLNLKQSKLSFQFFPSHLVDRSIWPLMLSCSLFALVIGTVQYFHGYSTGFLLLKAAALLTLIGAAYWWKDVVVEASFQGHHTKKVRFGIAQGFNLFILLSSGGFITYAHHALIANNRKATITGLFVTIVLALLFTFLQYVEYNQASFTFADSVYGSAFYATTGPIGLHFYNSSYIFFLLYYYLLYNYIVL